jgi:hypothetical protein
MKDPIIGYRLFLDGWRRPVYLAEDGRQYVIDGDETIFGFWVLTDDLLDDAPLIVRARKDE